MFYAVHIRASIQRVKHVCQQLVMYRNSCAIFILLGLLLTVLSTLLSTYTAYISNSEFYIFPHSVFMRSP
jgi:hypothetical protein